MRIFRQDFAVLQTPVFIYRKDWAALQALSLFLDHMFFRPLYLYLRTRSSSASDSCLYFQTRYASDRFFLFGPDLTALQTPFLSFKTRSDMASDLCFYLRNRPGNSSEPCIYFQTRSVSTSDPHLYLQTRSGKTSDPHLLIFRPDLEAL